MKIRHMLFFLSLAVLGLTTACGESNDEPNGGGSNEQDSWEQEGVINGTKLDGANNLVGLIKNAKTGEGIAGVPVTDGYQFTLTDENGVYQMKANSLCRKVYYSLPAAYKVNLDSKNHLPAFFSTARLDLKKVNRTDFELEPLDAPETDVTLIMIGDPQCKSNSDVTRYERETIPDIVTTVSAGQQSGKYKSVYAFTLGDETFDNVVQWPNMRNSMSNVRLSSGEYLPIFNTIGNHDHDASTDDDYSAVHYFLTYFGPTDYSLDRGNIHIIVMDDVICTTSKTTTWSYDGGLTNEQVKWLEADLANVKDKASKEVVFCAHIPFRNSDTHNQQKVLKMLAEFKDAHLMIGHTHYAQNYIHSAVKAKSGKPIYEHIHGAACGGWWSCNSNTDGSPNGYSIYEFNQAGLNNWVAKGTGEDPKFQMRVWNGNDSYNGTYEYSWVSGGVGGKANISATGEKVYANCFIAQIWNSDGPESGSSAASNWKVELITADGKSYPMTRVAANRPIIPAVSYFFNELSKNTSTWVRNIKHLWYVKAPSGNPLNEADGWVVRATQTIPYSGVTNVYECNTLQRDYKCF